MKLSMELDNNGYGTIHKAGCRDLRDEEPIGEADSLHAAHDVACEYTGLEEEFGDLHFAPCVKLPKA